MCRRRARFMVNAPGWVRYFKSSVAVMSIYSQLISMRLLLYVHLGQLFFSKAPMTAGIVRSVVTTQQNMLHLCLKPLEPPTTSDGDMETMATVRRVVMQGR